MRLVAREVMPLEHLHQHIATLEVPSRQAAVVVVGQRKRNGAGFLKRRRSADGEEVVHLPYRACQRGRRDRPAHTPAGNAVGLREAVDRHGAVGHPFNRGNRDVPMLVVNDVFVDLVRDGDDVPFSAERRDRVELVARENLPGRIVGRVENDGFRPVVEGGGELVGIEPPTS